MAGKRFGVIRPVTSINSPNGIDISLLNLKRVVALITALNGMSGAGSGCD